MDASVNVSSRPASSVEKSFEIPALRYTRRDRNEVPVHAKITIHLHACMV